MRLTSSGGAGAVALEAEAERREVGGCDRRVVDDLGPLRRHAADDGDALGFEEANHLVDRPRLRGDDDGDPPRELLPELGHVAGVRERRGNEPAVEWRRHDASGCDRGLEPAVVEPRALRQPRRPARPDDDDGIVR